MITDPYCGCELDKKFGMPIDWDPNGIWLDMVIILDCSEAMGKNSLVEVSMHVAKHSTMLR